VALPLLQMSSRRDQNAYRRTKGHDPHLSTVSPARQNLRLPCPGRSKKSPALGTLALLRKPGLPVEWGQGLCGEPEYREPGDGFSGSLLRNPGVSRVSYDLERGQALLLQGAGCGSTVEAAGDHTPPKRGQIHLLCRLVFDLTFMHVSERSNAFLALYFSIQETRASQCVKCMIVACFFNGCSCFEIGCRVKASRQSVEARRCGTWQYQECFLRGK
jgi:hypothetical protein